MQPQNFTSRVRAICPRCGQPGKSVPGQTVKAMLSVSLRQINDGLYLFCRTENCPVVYFSNDGTRIIPIEQVREDVYQKAPDSDDIKVCYCFGHTVSEIRNSNPANQKQIVEDINAGIAAGQCACDLRNPQGSCCLGNVLKLIRVE